MLTCRLTPLCLLMCVAAALAAGIGTDTAGAYEPWTPLTQDPHPDQAAYPGELAQPTWIGAGNVTVHAHTAGGGSADYALGFNDANQGTGDPAGNDALQFLYGGEHFGRHVGQMADSFSIFNGGGTGGGGGGGGSRTFTDVLLLVAIDSASLPQGFSFSVRQSGQAAYTVLDSSHFGYYDPTETGLDHATGRPSGNHANYRQVVPVGYPNPPELVLGTFGASYREPLAYDFEKGMVTIFALQGINVVQDGSASVDYVFENLPGKAVFSLYGYRGTEDRIKRTNQSVAPGDFTTFEVVPEPASALLMSLGAVLCLARRRRGRDRLHGKQRENRADEP